MAAEQPGGELSLFLGPMFSEKTTEIVRAIKRARLGGCSCVLVKYDADNRYGSGPVVRTHDGTAVAEAPATDDLGRLRVVEAHRLEDVELGPDELYVGVDEGQFYPDLPEIVDLWTREGRRVYVAALDGDFRRKPFGRVLEAIPLATNIVKLSAVCMLCAVGSSADAAGRPSGPADASFTVRIVAGETQELIGAKDKYRAACLACYLKANRS